MKENTRIRSVLKAINHYLVFFLLAAFVITCCMLLFLSVFSHSIDITFTENDVQLAAMLTFWNVVLLSFLFTVIDTVRRKITVDMPVKRIIEAAQQIMQGDFSVRIPSENKLSTDEKFQEVIECFNKMAEELGSVETLRTDFIANVSHEMKTPLSVMHNYGTLLQSPDLTDEKRIEYAKGVTDSSRKLADMMSNILKLNRLENQQIFPKVAEFDLGEQLCECLLQYENVWEKENIEIETEIEEDVKVRADSELLGLVWNNLFSNAFKFTSSGGKVFVSLSVEDNYAVVKVRDTGCGMTPEVGAHIFEKFYQGDNSRAVQGNGLGLALVKRVIVIVGGEIGVESEVGKGSTFTVKIGL
ncbi:MAG: HAMP domain-containing histidine kinase [Ruminococcaceae bacterium]|nr:HAMP domain-containing histidine kinase [Oscillospiraceae bacterium]